MFDYLIFYFFFFNDTATTEIYTLSLHDALPISHQPHRMVTLLSYNRHTPKASQKKRPRAFRGLRGAAWPSGGHGALALPVGLSPRSEEHTSELQSPCTTVCRLLLAKKKTSPSHLTVCRRT